MAPPVRSGSNSAVECQLPKLDVAGSIPVSRSNVFNKLERSSLFVGTTLVPLSGEKPVLQLVHGTSSHLDRSRGVDIEIHVECVALLVSHEL